MNNNKIMVSCEKRNLPPIRRTLSTNTADVLLLGERPYTYLPLLRVRCICVNARCLFLLVLWLVYSLRHAIGEYVSSCVWKEMRDTRKHCRNGFLGKCDKGAIPQSKCDKGALPQEKLYHNLIRRCLENHFHSSSPPKTKTKENR